MKLSRLIAGALSAALLTGMTVWVFAQFSGLLVWAAFIGWASYDRPNTN
jgi:hypothetical protein